MSRSRDFISLRTTVLLTVVLAVVLQVILSAIVGVAGMPPLAGLWLAPLSVLLAYLLFRSLSGEFFGALEHLTGTMHEVELRRDYRLRAQPQEGELAPLERGLNAMIAAVADRESELMTAQCELELRVSEVAVSNSELLAALKRLKTAQQQLVASEKMASLGGLVAGVAHEINTPVGVGVTAVSSMRSRVQSVKEKYQSGELGHRELSEFFDSTDQHCDLLMSNLQRAAELVSSFKKVAVDQGADDLREFDVGVYLSEVWRSLSPQLKGTALRYEIDLSGDLHVRSYPGAFSQILTNLVMNSLLHGYPQGGEGCLSLRLHRAANGDIEMQYRDDGQGIAADDLPKVFEPFFTTRRIEGGSGLGMHIVYNLVTSRLLGNIELTSELGKGVQVNICFPADLGKEAQDAG